jgi:hypothetical protein
MNYSAAKAVATSLAITGDKSVDLEVWRSRAAIVRHNARLLCEQTSLNLWHTRQNVAYLRFLQDEAATCTRGPGGSLGETISRSLF